MSGVSTSSLSLAWSLRNWVILDYEEPNGLTVRPWAPFLLYLKPKIMDRQGQERLSFAAAGLLREYVQRYQIPGLLTLIYNRLFQWPLATLAGLNLQHKEAEDGPWALIGFLRLEELTHRVVKVTARQEIGWPQRSSRLFQPAAALHLQTFSFLIQI